MSSAKDEFALPLEDSICYCEQLINKQNFSPQRKFVLGLVMKDLYRGHSYVVDLETQFIVNYGKIHYSTGLNKKERLSNELEVAFMDVFNNNFRDRPMEKYTS